MPTKKVPADAHVFGRPRPSATKGFKLHFKPRRDTHFRDLPPPTGEPPFSLDLKDILPDADYKAISKKKLTFHVNGDMGGIILTLHHPVYSADDHHSGSTYMKEAIETAAAAAGGRHPEMILAGHVHNYQRLTKDPREWRASPVPGGRRRADTTTSTT